MASVEKYLFVQRDRESSVYTAVAKYLEGRGGWKRQNKDSPRFNLMLGDRNKLPWHKFGQIQGLTQIVNYYRGSELLCRKAAMTRLFKEHCKKTRVRLFPWLPKSYVLTSKSPKTNLHPVRQRAAVSRSDEREELKQWAAQSSNSSIWIVKSTSGAKGEGIRISRSVDELIDYVDEQTTAFVCQQYIHPPLLLAERRKFDIRLWLCIPTDTTILRCWVLVDVFYNVCLYREGVLRTSSDPYSEDFSHVTAHLTNHCLQKEQSDNFGLYEEDNSMFFDDFDRYLRSCHGISLESKILPQIRTITRTCFLIIQEHIQAGSGGYWSFQLFGLDFMVDEDFHVWLLEINGAPACDSKLLPDMVRCLVETAIDPVYPPLVPVKYGENLFDRI